MGTAAFVSDLAFSFFLDSGAAMGHAKGKVKDYGSEFNLHAKKHFLLP